MTAREAMQDDLDSVFFEADDAFQQIVTHVTAGGDVEITVYAFDTEDDYEFSDHPFTEVWVRKTAVPLLSRSDTFVVNGKTMKIIDFRNDEFSDIVKIFLNGEMV